MPRRAPGGRPQNAVAEGASRPLRTMLLVAGGIVGLILCCVFGGYFFVRSTSPYDDAVAKAVAHKSVIKLLGEPVDASPFFATSFRVAGENGVATLQVHLAGSKQEGTLFAKGVKTLACGASAF